MCVYVCVCVCVCVCRCEDDLYVLFWISHNLVFAFKMEVEIGNETKSQVQSHPSLIRLCSNPTP